MRAHLFLCMLAYYVQWHMVKAWRELLHHLSTIVRNVCRIPHSDSTVPTFEVITTPTAKQQCAYELLKAITV